MGVVSTTDLMEPDFDVTARCGYGRRHGRLRAWSHGAYRIARPVEYVSMPDLMEPDLNARARSCDTPQSPRSISWSLISTRPGRGHLSHEHHVSMPDLMELDLDYTYAVAAVRLHARSHGA